MPSIASASRSCSATHRCYAAADGASNIGNTAAGLGDIDGDGIRDFAFGHTTDPERVDVYLGIDTPAVEGDAPLPSGAFLQISGQERPGTGGSAVFNVGDFNGDGLPDIGVGSEVNNMFYVVLGDSAWTDETTPLWEPGDAPLTLDLSDEGSYGNFRVVRITMVDPGKPTTAFGRSAAAMGDMFPDAGTEVYGDLAIQSAEFPNSVILLKGREITTPITDIRLNASPDPDDLTANDGETVHIRKEKNANSSVFGRTITGGVDLDGGGLPDLVIEDSNQGTSVAYPYGLYIVYGEALQDKLGTSLQGVGLGTDPASLGETVLVGARGVILLGATQFPGVLGDFDGAGGAFGSPDLVTTRFNPSFSGWGSVWIRSNSADAGAGIDYGTFPYVDATVTSPYPLEVPGNFGYIAKAVGDVNADGFPDILAGSIFGGFPTIIY